VWLFLLISLITIPSSYPPEAEHTETRRFRVMKGEKVLGWNEATRRRRGDNLYYTNTSRNTVSLIKRFVIDYHYEVTFRNNRLFHSVANVEVNGKQRTSTVVSWEIDCYRIREKGIETNCVGGDIFFTSVMLLFQEPVGQSVIFSEEDGAMHRLRYVGGTYEKTNLKGKVNRYFYENNRLIRAELNAGLVTVTITPETES
jgi:hypothetical protein